MLYNTLGCKNLSVVRNSNLLLSGLGFTLFPGAVLNIIGKNGSGKTSLLKIIASITKPASGEIICNQQNIRAHLAEYRSMVNYIGHVDSVFEELSVLHNLKFWAKLHSGMEAVDAASKYLGLDYYLDLPAKKLSRGWKKKVALARLLLAQKDFWILDEPFANLDEEGKQLLQNLITVKSSQGGIIIFSSHTESSKNQNNIQNLYLDDF